jgi:hypothetical protein
MVRASGSILTWTGATQGFQAQEQAMSLDLGCLLSYHVTGCVCHVVHGQQPDLMSLIIFFNFLYDDWVSLMWDWFSVTEDSGT